jgi:ribose-phosphate pyrophosphokinase
VAEVAQLAGCPYEVLRKHRSGDRQVEVSVPLQEAFHGSTPVILDDIASSGRTLIEAVGRLKAIETAPPLCVLIHAVFAGSAYQDILAAGAERVVSTDTIPHPSNAISIAPALADRVIPCLGKDLTK